MTALANACEQAGTHVFVWFTDHKLPPLGWLCECQGLIKTRDGTRQVASGRCFKCNEFIDDHPIDGCDVEVA